VLGLEPAQRDHMSVPEYMSPPYAYDVTFERGTRIVYGDRTHYYVSGTASIDTQGNALYPDDAEKQALRALENIGALLQAYEADLTDMKMMVVYLQDRVAYPSIRGLLKEVLPEKLPYIVVRGSVCRASWLVEMEGIAVSEARNERFRPFC
jgi:enamine deaminase RidA (YjgF/YER057c/UK114 family)